MRAILSHTEPTEVWEEEIHLCWRLSLWCQLKDNPDPIDVEFLTGERDVFGWSNQTWSRYREPFPEPTVDVASWARWQERTELICRTSTHCKTGNHIF